MQKFLKSLSNTPKNPMIVVIAVIAILTLAILTYSHFFLRSINISKVSNKSFLAGTAVKIAPVEKVNLPLIVNSFGSLVAYEVGSINSEIAGQIEKILFTPGQEVSAGQVLIKLKSELQEAILRQVSAEEKLIALEEKRNFALFKKGGISQQNLDEIRSRLIQKQAQVEENQARLEQTNLKAPFAGILGEKKVNVGDYVAPGQALINIVNNKILRANFAIPARYLDKIKLGQDLSLRTDSYPGKIFHGVLDFISPEINFESRSINLEARIDNSDGKLLPGLAVQVNLFLETNHEVLLIPEQALITQLDSYQVFRIKDGKAQLTKIQIGEPVAGKIQVLAGLTPQDQVIIEGQDKLHDGMAVHPIGPDKAA